MSEIFSLRPTLPAIITAARAGALDHANRLFRLGGYDDRLDDPSALAVKGRLLKDRALRLPPAERVDALVSAARAYAAADALAPQPYTRINTATLTFLAGEREKSCAIARELLAWIGRADGIAETPYYLAATCAEALLLCGDTAGASTAMRTALQHDPDGWADHASTLRQLALILDAQRASRDWLNPFRPPRSLYFAGHLGVAADNAASLVSAIDAVLATERVGFAFGALAAGSDIVVAERILVQGGELHVVLPTEVDDFIAQSVAPFGAIWLPRFDACLNAATSLRATAQVVGGYEPLATRLAADVAMGSAVLNASRLESEAVQLVVIDEGEGEFGTGSGTARDAGVWAATGRRQHCIRWPRNADVVASAKKAGTEGRRDRRLGAMLHISFDGIDVLNEAGFAEAVDTVLMPFRAQAAAVSPQPEIVLPAGNARIVAFSTPADAWRFAAALLALPALPRPLRIAGHYALAHWLDLPPALVGRGVTDLSAVAASALPGVLTVSYAFAASLFAGCNAAPVAEHIGETGDMQLFAIS